VRIVVKNYLYCVIYYTLW